MQLDGDVDVNQEGKAETRTGMSVWEHTTALYVRRKILSTLFTLLGLYREGYATNCRHYAARITWRQDGVVLSWRTLPGKAVLSLSANDIDVLTEKWY